VPSNPLRQTIAHQRAGIRRAFAISALGSVTYYVGITYVPAFLTTTGSLGEGGSLWFSVIPAFAVIIITPLMGGLSDRFGRKPVLILLAGLGAVLPVGMFSLMSSGSTTSVLLGAIVLACVAGGVSAVGAAATAEQFPGEGRMSGLALGATAATVVFGGLAPYVAQVLTEWTGSPMVPGALIAVVALGVLPVLLTMPETSHRQSRGLNNP